MTIKEALKSLCAYPMPDKVVNVIMIDRGLNADEEYTASHKNQKSYNLAKADVYWWFATVPDVSQEWVNFSFTQEEKLMFLRHAKAIYRQWGELLPEDASTGGVYGYKGDRL